ncbi:MAG: cell division protein ZapA [Elusimicrobiota bacterium]|jgi:cell division protein ZapA (FtsZ GTPase activity inhibitor)|nr:cell division protein ZapA [Elusimicrobiota bacterium]
MELIEIKIFDDKQRAWNIMGMDMKLSGIDETGQLEFLNVVNYVNDVWQEVRSKNSKTADTQKICILTAVRIAEELIKLKSLQENISSNNEKKLNMLIRQIENINLANQ